MAVRINERSGRPVRIFLTGFGRFPGAPSNPSGAVVTRIMRSGRQRLERCGIDLVAAVLPVEFDRIGEELASQLAANAPDGVLHLGLAGRRSTLSVETRARNRISQLHPDAAKRRPGRPTISAGGPERRNVRLPVMPLAVAMRRSGALTRLSNDAGAYICNAALYLSLGTEIPLAGFIHLPRPRPANRPLSRPHAGSARPSLSAMVLAIMEALLLIAAQARRHRAAAGEAAP